MTTTVPWTIESAGAALRSGRLTSVQLLEHTLFPTEFNTKFARLGKQIRRPRTYIVFGPSPATRRELSLH